LAIATIAKSETRIDAKTNRFILHLLQLFIS
jgi:hypothetical protein